MQTTIYYFLQVVFCSAIMMGYYWLVLRDNKFHQYNRFYLLAIAVLSWLIPLIKIQWNESTFTGDDNIYYLLSAVASNNTELESSFSQHWYSITWQRGLQLLYIGGVSVLFVSLMISLIRIFQLLKQSSAKKLGTIDLIMTNAKGTPYSFFQFIFWNEAIDLSSATGQQILQHEITHVKEKHSFDKLLMQCILIAGWMNPVFWLIKKELHMIHEFIADKKSVESGDTASLAQMLLTTAYPQQTFKLTNPFFFSPIKRRIAMLSKSNTRFSYLRRLIVLPLLAIIVVLVAFRNALPTEPISVETVVKTIYKDVAGRPVAAISPMAVNLKNDYTIVINAGHGGADKGSVGVDGKSVESQLTLELAKTIQSLNQNSRLNLFLTRTEDETQSLMEIAQKANKSNPDLFLSLHYNAAKNANLSGTEIYIASPGKTDRYNSHLQFANQVANQVDDLSLPFNGIKSRKDGIYVLQNISCPSILIEAGYMSNPKDLEKITSTSFRESLAVAILNGVQKYLADKENNLTLAVATQNDDFNNSGKDTLKLLVKKVESEAGKLSFDSVRSFSFSKSAEGLGSGLKLFAKNGQKPLVVLNGKQVEYEILNEMNPNEIVSITVLKNEAAISKYGAEGGNGVLEVVTKDANLKSIKPIQEEDNNDRSGIKSFMRRNKDVSNVSWNHQYKTMEIKLKDGTEEKYILNNQTSMRRAEAKYGKLPIPAPPPPPTPAPAKLDPNKYEPL
ncbi:M56/M15 family metallopeptidase [Sediminibacterium salmoneum]|uniref:M56/M15 family metallopeptidase n=1 Tax=Sediminibacterium salmoneum TaxID=426421 RepID=UPI00047BECC2|nr:M56/M15 family metallopeptidase [Sediminibacterium salmoneum]